MIRDYFRVEKDPYPVHSPKNHEYAGVDTMLHNLDLAKKLLSLLLGVSSTTSADTPSNKDTLNCAKL